MLPLLIERIPPISLRISLLPLLYLFDTVHGPCYNTANVKRQVKNPTFMSQAHSHNPG